MPRPQTYFYCALFAMSAFLLEKTPLMAQNRVEFSAPFAPADGYIKSPEKPLRQELCLNGRWQFQPVRLPAGFVRNTGAPPALALPIASEWESVPLKVPSAWNVNTWGNGRDAGQGTNRPYVADSLYYPSYPADWDGVEMGWLRRGFRVPANWGNRRVVLHFEAVAGEAQVLVNGKLAGSHFDSFLPFDLDVTDLIKRDRNNELLVGVRKSTLFNKVSADYPAGQLRTYPNGSNTDNSVGIWQDVYLLGLPALRVEDAFIKPQVDQGVLEAEVTLRNDTAQRQRVQVGADVKPWVNLAGKDILSGPVPRWRLDSAVLTLPKQGVNIAPHSTAKVTLRASVGSKLKFWSPDTPNLYGAVFQVNQTGGAQKLVAPLDTHYVRFGWRQFKIRGRDLLLNNQKIQLFGDFSHPFGPYVNSRRYIWQFYKMIKAMGGNMTRPHAQVHPRAFLEVADEIGLCVLDEASIFGSSINLNLKEDITWKRLEKHVDGMVLRDRNSPSVFGYSPGNEIFALFFKTEKAERDREYVRLKALMRRPFLLDSTREWVSCDGDEDLEGTLPIWSKHMGVGLPAGAPTANKPWMIGEHGGTYYAGPPRLEEINGDRSYESYAARNEALAIDLYRMITKVARPDLAAFSPSELVWFGLEPLPFGYRVDNRPPNTTDGIFFPGYRENAPGEQIERLPPYVMTINPGFDPSLPAYKPLAMFDAMKAALHKGGPLPSPWDKMPAIEKRQQPAPSNAIDKVAFAGDLQGELFASLSALGIPFVTGDSASTASLLLIDGETLGGAQAPTTSELAKAISGRGGMVWVMVNDKGSALPQLQELLGGAVNITNRQATSLAKGEGDPAINGFGLAQLYFVNPIGDSTVQKVGLAGPAIQNGKVLLTASNSDWTLFERQPESAKTSSMVIYEHLQKPAGAALVEVTRGAGRLWISSLDATSRSKPITTFWTQLFRNVGVKLTPLTSHWLVEPGRDAEVNWKYATGKPADSWAGQDFDDSAWKTGLAGFGGEVPQGKPRTNWNTPDIYLRRAFSVEKLPRTLRLSVHHDEDVQVFINGTLIFSEANFLSDYKVVPLGDEALKALKVGRNVIAVHCHQTAGGQYVDVGLETDSLPAAKGEPGHNLLLDGPLG